MRTYSIAAIIGAALALSAPAVAQDYPNKPIELIVAFGAGGTTDIGARVLSSIAEKKLGQPIVVLNKSGAGGQLGWTDLANSNPDGYKLGYINLPNLSSIIADPGRMAVFNADSFTPIVNHIVDPGIIFVRADSPYKSLNDLLKAAKDKPNTVRAATTGLLGDDHFAILAFQKNAPGVLFRPVHLTDSTAELKEVLAGNVDVGFDNVGALVKYLKSGEVRALAVLDKQRSKFLPDVPTATELGYPVVSSSSRAIAGPAGMDPAVVKKLQDVFLEAMKDPEHISKLEGAGFAIKPMTAAEFKVYFADVNASTKDLLDAYRKRN